MNIAGFVIIYFSNFKKNPLNLDKKNKISNLKIDIIINNIIEIRKNDDLNFSNNENDFRRENKRKKRFYNKENNDENGKMRITKLNKYYKKRKKFEF